jgi:glycosyltransferase involved in cell wall biosynthesis
VSTVAPKPAGAVKAGPYVSFIVPVHDEEATIRLVLERLILLPLRPEIIVVDDGSTDATPQILEGWCDEHPETTVITQPNRGKGAAVRAGIDRANGDFVVIQDADLEYDPAHVPDLIAPLVAGEAEVVYGSRLAPLATVRTWNGPNRLGNRALSLLTSLLYLRRLTDMETGHKAFRREVLQEMDLHEDDFGIEPEITAHVLRRGLSLVEIPITSCGRSHADGKEIHWRDGARAVRVLLVNRFRPVRSRPGSR